MAADRSSAFTFISLETRENDLFATRGMPFKGEKLGQRRQASFDNDKIAFRPALCVCFLQYFRFSPSCKVISNVFVFSLLLRRLQRERRKRKKGRERSLIQFVPLTAVYFLPLYCISTRSLAFASEDGSSEKRKSRGKNNIFNPMSNL